MKAAKARLARFRVLAYRSCKDAQFNPEPHVTALIGPNGAGKTNLMHAILLLSLSAPRRRSLDRDDLYASKCRIEADFVVGKRLIRYRSSVTYSSTDYAHDEVIVTEDKWNFRGSGTEPTWVNGEDLEFHYGGAFGAHVYHRALLSNTRRLYDMNKRLLYRTGKTKI